MSRSRCGGRERHQKALWSLIGRQRSADSLRLLAQGGASPSSNIIIIIIFVIIFVIPWSPLPRSLHSALSFLLAVNGTLLATVEPTVETPPATAETPPFTSPTPIEGTVVTADLVISRLLPPTQATPPTAAPTTPLVTLKRPPVTRHIMPGWAATWSLLESVNKSNTHSIDIKVSTATARLIMAQFDSSKPVWHVWLRQKQSIRYWHNQSMINHWLIISALPEHCWTFGHLTQLNVMFFRFVLTTYILIKRPSSVKCSFFSTSWHNHKLVFYYFCYFLKPSVTVLHQWNSEFLRNYFQPCALSMHIVLYCRQHFIQRQKKKQNNLHHWCILIIFGQQWSCMVWRNEIYHDLASYTICDQFARFDLHVGFIDIHIQI